jgi:hypothetical protein
MKNLSNNYIDIAQHVTFFNTRIIREMSLRFITKYIAEKGKAFLTVRFYADCKLGVPILKEDL